MPSFEGTTRAGANLLCLHLRKGGQPLTRHRHAAMPVVASGFPTLEGSCHDRLTQPFHVSYSPDLPRLRLPGATQVIGRQRFPT